MGLDIYLEWDGMTEAEQNARYTGYVNAGGVGYLRSSYNDSGFNSWAMDMLGVEGFYHIFQPNGAEEVEDGFVPDWDASLARSVEMLTRAKDLPGDNDYYIEVLSKHVPAFIELGKRKLARTSWSR